MESVLYNNWFYQEEVMSFVSTTFLPENIPAWQVKSFQGCIPIGTIEFVLSFINKYYNKSVLPINVPTCLFKYANRDIFNGTEKDIKQISFIKSNDKIKGFIDIAKEAPVGNYQISSIISDIISEYRVFVYKGKIVGLKHYCGDFSVFPDINIINNIVKDYINQPIAYTLDIGIDNLGVTFIIEINQFFSCGLYGFNDYKILPYMYKSAFLELI